MSNEFSKLNLHAHQTEQATSVHQTGQRQQAREFASVEEMIRTDKDGIEAPPEVAQRLNESISHEPAPRKPWWKRVFGRRA